MLGVPAGFQELKLTCGRESGCQARTFLPFSVMQGTGACSLRGPLGLQVTRCHRESLGILSQPASLRAQAMDVAVGLTTWHDALETQDIQPAVFSGLTPPPTSPSLTLRAETHAALSSISLQKQEWGLGERVRNRVTENFPRSSSPRLPLCRLSHLVIAPSTGVRSDRSHSDFCQGCERP